MAYGNWKSVERMHSKLLKCGGRIGPTGKDLPDSCSDVLSVESKSMGIVPKWLHDAITQSSENAERLAEHNGEPAGQRLAIAVAHQTGSNYIDDLVFMTMRDFTERVLPLLEHAAGHERFDAARTALLHGPDDNAG